MFIWKVTAKKAVIMSGFKFLKSERKIAPVHAMEVYGGSGYLNPLIRNLCTRWRWMLTSHTVYSTFVGEATIEC